MRMKSTPPSTHLHSHHAIACVLICCAVECLAFAGLLRAQTSSIPAGNPQSELIALDLGKPIDRELRGGEKHSYKVHAEAGQYVHVVVLQEGIDVAVMLFDPSGKQILTADSLNGSYGPETASTIVEASGNLRLDVSAGSNEAPAGHYQIQLKDLRPPVETDRIRIKAEQTYMDGTSFYLRGSAESVRAAAAEWQESIALWKSLDDKYGQALSQYSIGAVYSALGEKQKALEYYNQALPLERSIGDNAGEAATLSNLGAVYDSLGEKQKALDCYKEALPLESAVGDLAGEAVLLTAIGESFARTGENQKALDYFNQALPFERARGDRAHEENTLNDIGFVYFYLGDQKKALDFDDQALTLARALKDRAGEANALTGIGAVYSALGNKQKALEFYNEALPLERASGDRQKEADTLHNIGAVYSALGEKQKALDYYNRALPLKHAVGDRKGEANTLTNIGVVFDDLGERQKALDFFNLALPLRRAVGDRGGEANTLQNIGYVYASMGESQKAMDYYDQALMLERAVGSRVGEAYTLHNIGRIYSDIGEKQKALDYYSQALEIERAVANRTGEALTLINLGKLYSDLGEKQKALDFFTQSLPLFRAVQDPLGEAGNLADLMEYWRDLQNPSLAVLFGKQAIDRFQQVRRNIQGLEKETQQSFLKSKESYYRDVAELLISQGRLPEAQQVLDLLKLEEYSEFTHRRGDTGTDTKPVALTPNEEKANKDYELITADITAIGSEYAQLNAKSPRSADEEKRLNELSDKLTAANRRIEIFFSGLYDSFGKGDQANNRVRAIKDDTAGLQAKLVDGAVGVYTVVNDQKCELIVITPAVQVSREVPIGRIALSSKVNDFLTALAHHHSEQEIQAEGQDLYKILIAPIEKDLRGAHARTIVWSLDDVLRYVPVAALYDGKQYLVERYRNVAITTLSVANLDHQPQLSNLHGLAMGVSKIYNPEDGLGPLSAVPGELRSVVHSTEDPASHGPVSGTIMLDDAFTETRMESALELHPPLVHIASHYVFQLADDKSYLLLGGKDTGGQGFHLTLADMRDDQRMNFKGIELLTLSGCQTAVGSNDSDGREIDGLGITAQRKGAKAVMASLWMVEDESVGSLMATFYKQWTTTAGVTKSEALQQAQLTLLHGADSRYTNPYYWAPFILIGNWK
jgi:CHAT domain-containing protein/tetratricopeptide (TPR) repeat protein